MNEELKFDLSKINNLQKRQLNEIEKKFVCIPYKLFKNDIYKRNELKFLLHVYIYIERSYKSTLNFIYDEFFEWTNISKDKRTRAKNKKEIDTILKEMEYNNLIKIYKTESAYIRFEILKQFIYYSEESFYNNGFISIYLDEVEKIMNYDTSGIKRVTNGLLLYTYVWLVRRIKSYAKMCNKGCCCVREFYYNLCNNIYSNKEAMKDTIKCLQDLGLIYATLPKRYKKEDGSISHSATIFALPYLRDCEQGTEYYGENYIKSVIEYEERR